MKHFIISAIHKLRRIQRFPLWTIIFWLAVWQITAMSIQQEILLASPVSVIQSLSQLLFQAGFWQSILFTFGRIFSGFLVSASFGIFFAAVSSSLKPFRQLLAPLVSAIQSTPVASFTILILVWVSPKNLSAIMAILMAFPIIYSSILTGIEQTDRALLQMAALFRIPFGKKLRYIYIPQIFPSFRSAVKVSLGLCWKAGVAAEVIGLPSGSIGERLYEAKIYLETADLFAWTVVIIVINILMERCIRSLLDIVFRQLKKEER